MAVARDKSHPLVQYRVQSGFQSPGRFPIPGPLFRALGTVGRDGGDAFALLLVDAGLDGALSGADRIRQSVASHSFGAERGLDLRLTVSVGVANFPTHGDSRERLLDLSDKAMYLAKALGRDHVCSADELSSSRG